MEPYQRTRKLEKTISQKVDVGRKFLEYDGVRLAKIRMMLTMLQTISISMPI